MSAKGGEDELATEGAALAAKTEVLPAIKGANIEVKGEVKGIVPTKGGGATAMSDRENDECDQNKGSSPDPASHQHAKGMNHEEAKGVKHEEAKGVKHEEAKGAEHEEVKGVNHDVAKGVNHDVAKGVNHDVAKGVKHEEVKGVKHDVAKGVNHEEAKGVKGVKTSDQQVETVKDEYLKHKREERSTVKGQHGVKVAPEGMEEQQVVASDKYYHCLNSAQQKHRAKYLGCDEDGQTVLTPAKKARKEISQTSLILRTRVLAGIILALSGSITGYAGSLIEVCSNTAWALFVGALCLMVASIVAIYGTLRVSNDLKLDDDGLKTVGQHLLEVLFHTGWISMSLLLLPFSSAFLQDPESICPYASVEDRIALQTTATLCIITFIPMIPALHAIAKIVTWYEIAQSISEICSVCTVAGAVMVFVMANLVIGESQFFNTSLGGVQGESLTWVIHSAVWGGASALVGSFGMYAAWKEKKVPLTIHITSLIFILVYGIIVFGALLGRATSYTVSTSCENILTVVGEPWLRSTFQCNKYGNNMASFWGCDNASGPNVLAWEFLSIGENNQVQNGDCLLNCLDAACCLAVRQKLVFAENVVSMVALWFVFVIAANIYFNYQLLRDTGDADEACLQHTHSNKFAALTTALFLFGCITSIASKVEQVKLMPADVRRSMCNFVPVFPNATEPAFSCTNNIQDGPETGVDCGAVCGNNCAGDNPATMSPTNLATLSPSTAPSSSSPSTSPTTDTPTTSPSETPTFVPTTSPTQSPTSTTPQPSTSPTTSIPTTSPTMSPSPAPSTSPTTSPSLSPTYSPTVSPTLSPTFSPTSSPSVAPSSSPSESPTSTPTRSPQNGPTASPTASPTYSDYGVTITLTWPTSCSRRLAPQIISLDTFDQVSQGNDGQVSRWDWEGQHLVDDGRNLQGIIGFPGSSPVASPTEPPTLSCDRNDDLDLVVLFFTGAVSSVDGSPVICRVMPGDSEMCGGATHSGDSTSATGGTEVVTIPAILRGTSYAIIVRENSLDGAMFPIENSGAQVTIMGSVDLMPNKNVPIVSNQTYFDPNADIDAINSILTTQVGSPRTTGYTIARIGCIDSTGDAPNVGRCPMYFENNATETGVPESYCVHDGVIGCDGCLACPT